MSESQTMINADKEFTLYALVDLKTSTIVKRAPLWEIQQWTTLLNGGSDPRKDNLQYKRLDLLSQQELLSILKTPLSFRGMHSRKELIDQALEIAQQVPVDETSPEQLRQMLVERGLTRPGKVQQNSWREKKMSTTETQVNQANTATATAAAAPVKAPKAKSTKQLIRELFTNPSAAYSLEEIQKATGKEKGSVTTAISDLKSIKYCQPGTTLALYRHSDGKYRLTEEVKAEKAPAAPASTTEDNALPA